MVSAVSGSVIPSRSELDQGQANLVWEIRLQVVRSCHDPWLTAKDENVGRIADPLYHRLWTDC